MQVQLCSLLLLLANGEAVAYDKALDRVVAAACSCGGGASAAPLGGRRRAAQIRSAQAVAAAMAGTAATDAILSAAGSGSTAEAGGANDVGTSVLACGVHVSQAAGSMEETSSPPPPPPRRSPGGRAAALRRLIDGWCRTTVGCAAEQQQVDTATAAPAPAAAFGTLRPLLEAVWQLGEPAPLIDTKRSGSATELQVGPNPQRGCAVASKAACDG